MTLWKGLLGGLGQGLEKALEVGADLSASRVVDVARQRGEEPPAWAVERDRRSPGHAGGKPGGGTAPERDRATEKALQRRARKGGGKPAWDTPDMPEPPMVGEARAVLGRGRPRKYDHLLQEGSEPPPAPGLYQLRNELTGKVDYVGKAENLRSRIGQHARASKPGAQHTVEWKTTSSGASESDRLEEEKRLVKRHGTGPGGHNPDGMNKNGGGGGRRAKPRG